MPRISMAAVNSGGKSKSPSAKAKGVRHGGKHVTMGGTAGLDESLQHKFPVAGSAAMKAGEELLHKRRVVTADERRKEQVATEGVKQSIYLGYIHKELSNEASCLELPLTIVILVGFSMFAMGILRQDQIYAVENAIEFDILENANFAWAHNFGHKGLVDVNSIADFWSWMRLGLLPLTVMPTWPYSEDYPSVLGSPAYAGTNYGRPVGQDQWLFPGYDKPSPVQNDYLRYNRIIGGIRMHQTVAQASKEYCRWPSSIDPLLLEKWLGKPCMPADDGVLTPELRDSETFAELDRVEWLLPELDSVDELLKAIIDMEDGCSHAGASGNLASCRCESCKAATPRQPWIDEQTSRVEVAFVTYNAQYGMYSYVGTNVMFNRGGHIHKFVNVMSSWADPLARPLPELLPMVVSGGVWALIMVYVFINEVNDIIGVVRNSHEGCWKALKEDYIGFWNMVDWISLAVGALLVVFFVDLRSQTEAVNAQLVLMMQASLKTASNQIQRAEYQENSETFFMLMDSMLSSEKTFRLTLFFYPMMIMMRLFKSFAAQARLAIVTKTLQRATEDLIHFGIVFGCVLFCLVVDSILFFGQDVEDFTTLMRSINSCFRAMFGEWDFDAMKEIGLIKAQAWFFIFMVIIVLILLNMLLAVIMDAYTEEKARSKSAQSLASQTFDMVRRFKQSRKGERIRLNDIWAHFEEEYKGDMKAMMADERMLKVDFLTDNVHKLQAKQAKRTLENSLMQYENALEVEVTQAEKLGQIQDNMAKVESRLQTVIEDVGYMSERVQYYDRLECPGDPEFDFHFGSEGRSAAQAAQEAVSVAVTNMSQELSGLFVDNLKKIEGWQDGFERQQNELHSMVSEMQIMVRQQAWSVAAMSEAVSQLEDEEQAAAAAGAAPLD